jgi:hypothetical protein
MTVSLNVLGFVFFMLGLRGVLTASGFVLSREEPHLLECGFGSEIVYQYA